MVAKAWYITLLIQVYINTPNSLLVRTDIEYRARAKLIAKFYIEIKTRLNIGLGAEKLRVVEYLPKVIDLLDMEPCRGL